MPSRDPFNRLYEGMLPFHENFRRSYAQLQQALPVSQRLPKRDLERFLAVGMQMCHHLEMHHQIEVSTTTMPQRISRCLIHFSPPRYQETYIFPLLAKRMPAFGHDDAHRKEHAVMHTRLEAFEAYIGQVGGALNSSRAKGLSNPEWPRDIYDGEKMKEIIDALGEALFPHLKAEEESLKAKSMRAAGWTAAEIARIPM